MGTRSVRRNSNRNRIKIVILIVMLVIATALGVYIFFAVKEEKMPKDILNREKTITRYAHFSIDDATQIFQDISFHGYESIFENEVLGDLLNLHKKYGLKVTLYVFGELDDFCLWDFPTTYKQEFEENSDWLKIGYHSMKEENPQKIKGTEKEFISDFERVNRTIIQIAGEKSLTHTLRLHYWYAPEWMVQDMKERGVTGLLCSDAGKLSYDLNGQQQDNLYASRDGKLRGHIQYYVTDIRLEKTDDVEASLTDKKGDRIKVVFTHAWCYMDNKDKTEIAIRWLVNHRYQFTFLEE